MHLKVQIRREAKYTEKDKVYGEKTECTESIRVNYGAQERVAVWMLSCSSV